MSTASETKTSALRPTGNLRGRKRLERIFYYVCFAATAMGILLLGLLLFGILRDGLGRLNFEFLTVGPSYRPARAGVYSALMGTLWVIGLTALIAVPIGIAAAVYLEEFASKRGMTGFIQMNIANLAGVPSIVYGLLGLAVFVRWLALGRSVLAGALTMSLLILPTVIIATQEALRAVPKSLREASLGLGATRWETIRYQVLPAAFSGIMTGIILSVSRAMGETAPLIIVGAVTFVRAAPQGVLDKFTALPIQIFDWTSRPQEAFHSAAAAGIIVLLVVLLALNSIAIYLRYRLQKR